MPKKNIKVNLYHLTIEQKKKICEWKRDSPAKSSRTLAEEASAIFGRVVPHQTVSRVLQKKDEILGQKTKPGSLDCHVHDLRRTEFEKRLIKKLGEMFDYGNVSQATIEQEATALSKEMPEVKFATGTKFKRCWIRGFTRRMNWVFKRWILTDGFKSSIV